MPSPASTDPFFVHEGHLVSVIFHRNVDAVGQPYESGGHLLLPIPQEAEATHDVRDAIAAACRGVDRVHVYERVDNGRFIFRGLRQLIEASPTADGARIQLVFAPDVSDEARMSPLNSGTVALLGPSLTRALIVAAPREQIAEAENVPESLQKIALLQPSRRKADRTLALKRARQLLLQARNDIAAWKPFRDWLIQKKPEFDLELLETILKLALDSGCESISVIHLGRLILGDDDPVTQGFARAFCVALAETRNADALAWASKLLPAASLDENADPELQLAAARIFHSRGEFKDACSAFERIVDDTSQDEAEWMAEYLWAAIDTNDRRAMKSALRKFDAALARCVRPSDMAHYQEAMGFAIDLEERLNSARPLDRIEQSLQLLVAINESRALKEYQVRTAGFEIKSSERLRFLSILEDCEDPRNVQEVWHLLSQVARETLRQPRIDLSQDAIDQLMLFEEAIGDSSHVESKELRSQLEARQARVGSTPARSLDTHTVRGKNILLVGGRTATRAHASQELLRLGASDVRQIPPSWEQHVDEAVVLSKARGADIVATLTDCMKHDAAVIVGNLYKAGLGFRPVKTSGGPSRIVRDILAAV
jgi:tetratricopeptide (TPR) repeat protein